ncbi:ATP-dependent helicase [Candidatus Nomurabacteria bacterium]|nr:ATP-dependent helicase [Candidatus Nomurabacteria bacterium]
MAELLFTEEYKKLNFAQKEAVDLIDGPVMVVAGPGTGKTQVLALRIANILKKTDVGGDSILCLTFTNSAVGAMRERLVRYIGEAGQKVNIFTFHSFGLEIIEKYFDVLGLREPPKLLDESESAEFFDEILETGDWEFLRPRGDKTRYFVDLKSLFSLLKRERITAEDFAVAIEQAIKKISESEDSISTRGASKGELKQEVKKDIESLEKSREVARFLEVYEVRKKEKNMLDYDDVLENLVRIMETSEEALADIREQYLYILVDEHQDSSRVQNEFLSRAWGEVEAPNIFVVGDDRQLIYGFAGASIDHFISFQKTFPGAKLVPLLENYRSTQVILDAAHALLPSVLSKEKLVSQSKEAHPIKLVEAQTPREEIFAAGEAIKKKIAEGVNPNACALLVPQNMQARTALEILHAMNLPLALEEALNLFDQKEAHALLRILKIISKETTKSDAPALALSFWDDLSGIPPLEAHKFLASLNMREFSFESLLNAPKTLWGEGAVGMWLGKLAKWQKDAEENDLSALLEIITREIFNKETAKKRIVPIADIAATFLALLEKRPEASLPEFVAYLDKVVEYGDPIPLITEKKNGVRVLTMHKAKGLEFDFVWIAHMDERSLTGGRKFNFALPESIKEKIEERDIDAVKRKLFVAITRAKRFCALSYASASHKGREQELAKIIAELPEEVFSRHPDRSGSRLQTSGEKLKSRDLAELKKLVKEKYAERYVSASMLNNFFECPWKWYFRNLLGMQEPTNENLIFGSAVHAALERILKLGKIVLPDNEEVARVVKAWAERRLHEIEKARESEYPLSVGDKRFPHLKIYGKIDLLEKLGGNEVRVTDFKTGSARKKSEIEKLDDEGRLSGNLRQLAMYAYLIETSPKWRARVSESALEFVEAKDRKNAFYRAAITPNQIKLLVKDIRDYNELVLKGEWVNRPCNYNSYGHARGRAGNNTECEYCTMAEIYKA